VFFSLLVLPPGIELYEFSTGCRYFLQNSWQPFRFLQRFSTKSCNWSKQKQNTQKGCFILCLYTTQLEHISSLKSNSQRAERVVTLYFYIRIRVRGDATGEGSPPAAIQRFPSFFILAERGLGRAAINTKGNFGVAFAFQPCKSSSQSPFKK